MKSEEEMTVEAATTIVNGGAYFFIDAINPDGTLEKPVYERMGGISAKLRPFRELLKKHVPEILAETALYYSAESYVGGDDKADIMSESAPEKPAVVELSGAAALLAREHIPFRAVHARTQSFDGLKTNNHERRRLSRRGGMREAPRLRQEGRHARRHGRDFALQTRRLDHGELRAGRRPSASTTPGRARRASTTSPSSNASGWSPATAPPRWS
jgi:hypothetical protein